MKHYGKLTAAAAAGFMALSAMGVAPVFADGPNTDWDVDIIKTITKDKNTAVPNEQFKFTVSQPESVAPEKDIPMHKGTAPDTDITVTNPTTPTTDTNNAALTSVSATGGKIVVNKDVFAGRPVGIHRYVVSETKGNVEDLTYSDAKYNVDVFVTVSGDTTAATGLRVTPVDSSKGEGSKANGMNFTNDYTKKTNANIHNLVVTKTVTGNQADMNQQFKFNTVVTGANGESFYWATSDAQKKESGIATSGSTITCSLGNNETLTVYGLSKTDQFTVNETNADGSAITGNKTSDGYTVTQTENAYVADSGENATVAVNNDRTGTIPTGILMSAAPYAGLVGLGGIFAGLFFRRKRED